MSFPTTAILDTGSGVDQNPLDDANWSPVINTNVSDGLKRLTNKFRSSDNFENDAYWDITAFAEDQEVYVTYDTVAAGSVKAAVYCRLTNLHTGTPSGYRAQITSADVLTIQKIVAGVYTTLNGGGSGEGITFASGDSLGLECIGSSIKAYRKTGGTWSQLGSTVTDSAVTGSGKIGIGQRTTDFNTDGIMSNFGGGDVVTGGPSGPMFRGS